jgi:hypothetical protein
VWEREGVGVFRAPQRGAICESDGLWTPGRGERIPVPTKRARPLLCDNSAHRFTATHQWRHLAAPANPRHTLGRFQEEIVVLAATSYSRDAFGRLQEEVSSCFFRRDGTGTCCEDHQYGGRHYHRQTWKYLFCLRQLCTSEAY